MEDLQLGLGLVAELARFEEDEKRGAPVVERVFWWMSQALEDLVREGATVANFVGCSSGRDPRRARWCR